ncbi:MAG TPA: M1 family metallopeptidase [Anaeromyxobacteraceae bacterium]|nr:M1 family metallopeptidase [Anaeromyxobacteraceae bacterium]
MRLASLAPAAALAAALACAGPQRPANSGEQPPELQLPDDVRPLRYALELTVDPAAADGFSGTGEIAVRLARPLRTIWLHGRDLEIATAMVEAAGEPPAAARWQQVNGDGLARLDLPREIGPGPATLRLSWSARWGAVRGLYTSRAAGDAYASTQLEAIDARRVFPGFDDPRFKTPFEVTVVVPERLVAVSNGAEGPPAPAGPGTKRVRFSATPPIPTYLVFVAVGPFDVVAPPPLPPNEVRAAPLSVRGLAPRGRGPELAYALDRAAETLVWLERYFGIAFPYEKLDHVALPEFSSSGMENAGAIAYSDRALLVPAGAGDERRRGVASVVAHELAHQWFGDLVTLPWWTDVWLNESFATWMTFRSLHALHPADAFDLELRERADAAMQLDSLASSRAIRKPLARMADVGLQFDRRVTYAKGAAVLAALERFVGPEAYRAALRRYLETHSHGTGTTAELLAGFSRAAGRDLDDPFATFLDQPGVPLVAARTACDPDRGARVELAQSRSLPRGSKAAANRRWGAPVCVRFAVGPLDGERCTLLEGAAGSIALPEGCPDWIMPDAGGVAYARWTLPPRDLVRLRSAGLQKLLPPEKISVVQSLAAAQRAGTVTYADAADTIATLGRDPDPAVAGATVEFFRHAREALVPAAARAAADAASSALYRPALARLGWWRRPGEPAADGRLRARLVEFLALVVRDPDVAAEAARLGAAYAGIADGAFHAEAVDPDLADAALAAAATRGGAPVFYGLLARLGSVQDGPLRLRILNALAAAEDAALVERAAGLWRDPRLTRVERLHLLRLMQEGPGGPARALGALEHDPGAYLAALVETHRAAVPSLLEGLCSARDADRVRAALEPSVAAYPQLRSGLDQTLERIAICAAERAADGEAAGRWFEARAAVR